MNDEPRAAANDHPVPMDAPDATADLIVAGCLEAAGVPAELVVGCGSWCPEWDTLGLRFLVQLSRVGQVAP